MTVGMSRSVSGSVESKVSLALAIAIANSVPEFRSRPFGICSMDMSDVDFPILGLNGEKL